MRQYSLMRNEDFIPKRGAEYGRILDVMGRTRLIAIFDPDCFITIGMHCSTTATDDLQTAIVHFDKMYLDRFNNNPMYFAVTMMHELGHIIDISTNPDQVSDLEKSDIMQERTKSILNGVVDPKEKAADRFAADQLGIGNVKKFLRDSIEERKRRNDIGKAIAIKEFELRIQAIEEYAKEKRKQRINK